VEHLGIIALGVGLGTAGTMAALFHLLNHSLTKCLAFFSAGRLGQLYGTHDLTRMRGVLRAAPVWGFGLFVSLLALIGVAPFAIFMSEFQLLKAAVDTHHTWAVIFFLAGTGVVFAGALRHAMSAAWEEPPEDLEPENAGPIDRVLMWSSLAAILALGLVMPAGLRLAIGQAARIVGGAGS
jgi:hydrogenase-4 component F